MSKQHGYICEKNSVFHIRYYVHENGKRRQRSAKLCNKDETHYAKDAPAVVKFAEDFMLKINQANNENDAAPGHKCPLCGNRCPRTIEGKFSKQV